MAETSVTEPEVPTLSSSPPPDATGGPLERRVRVTLLFADLCDYTALSESIDPEEIAEIRRQLMLAASEVIGRHRGEVNQIVGDGIVAMFGFPENDEEDGRHAINAALELNERARSLEWSAARSLADGLRLRMHAGIHSGVVFARKGDALHGQYQLTGDVVNTTARLCSFAAADEVVVSDSALRGLEGFFEAEPVELLRLKGKRQPVNAFRILRSLEVETRFQARLRRGLTPFVGRRTELRNLEGSLSDTCVSAGRLLCLVGDAGMGKTRLLDEFRTRALAAGVQVHRGFCESYGGMAPLRPFLQVVRELLPIAEDAPLEQRILGLQRGLEAINDGLLPHLPAFLQLLSIKAWSGRASTEERQNAIVSAVADLLLATAGKQPQVLLLDDWQWSDGASVRVLAQLVHGLRDRPLLVVVAARSIAGDDPVLGTASALSLQPFNEEESARAAQLLVAEGVTPPALRGLHQRSGGNPLFLEELCSRFDSSERLATLETDPIPTTIHALIRARVESLSPELSDLLGTCAVIGNDFPKWLLAELDRHGALEARLELLVGTGLLQPTDSERSLRFKHGLTREVVYETVRVYERRETHRSIAQALERHYDRDARSDHYEVLAAHYAQSNDHRLACEYAELAGDKAAATSALDGARLHYFAALNELDLLPNDEALRRRWLEIVRKWSAACVYYPSREQLMVLWRAARYAEEVQDFKALAQVEYWTGWIYYGLGGQESAISHLQRSLELSEHANNERHTAQLLVNIGQSYAAAGEYEPALDFLNRGLELKRKWLPLGVGAAYALGCRALVHGDRGEFAVAYLQAQEGLAAVRDLGNAIEGSIYGLLGMIQLWQGAWHDALETAARGRATAVRVNGPYVLAMCEAVGSFARWRLDRSSEALDAMLRAVEWLERREITLYLSFCYGHLARAELEANRDLQAREHAERALERAAHGDPLGRAMAHRVLAILAARADDQEEARQQCEKAFRSAELRSSPREAALTQLTLAELEQGWGNSVRSLELLREAQASFAQLRMTWHVAEVDRLLRGRRTHDGEGPRGIK